MLKTCLEKCNGRTVGAPVGTPIMTLYVLLHCGGNQYLEKQDIPTLYSYSLCSFLPCVYMVVDYLTRALFRIDASFVIVGILEKVNISKTNLNQWKLIFSTIIIVCQKPRKNLPLG